MDPLLVTVITEGVGDCNGGVVMGVDVELLDGGVVECVAVVVEEVVGGRTIDDEVEVVRGVVVVTVVEVLTVDGVDVEGVVGVAVSDVVLVVSVVFDIVKMPSY
jgi:hypothetical protein